MDYNLKLEMFQKIYIVFGDPKNQTIFSGIVTGIHINCKNFENQEVSVYYTYSHIKFLRSKKGIGYWLKELLTIGCGSVDQEYIDCKEKCKAFSTNDGLYNWPVFTSKERCIEYLRRFKDG